MTRERITSAERQRIINDIIERDGFFSPRAFVEEVQATKGRHPAWGWFTWDDETAAAEHRVEEARNFARGLRVKWGIEVIDRGKIRVKSYEAPFIISPMQDRKSGGGYVVLNMADNPGDFQDEAATALQAWLTRYGGAVIRAGISTKAVENLLARLGSKSEAA